MRRFEDKVVVVTGASSGIGAAAARRIGAEGGRVVLAARDEERLAAVAADIAQSGSEALIVPCDVDDPGHAQHIVDLATARFGGVDLAFDNVGAMSELGPVEGLSLDGWERAIRTNLTSAFLAARAQVPAMRARGGGSIVFTGTFVGQTAALPGMAAYTAAKAGLLALARTLAMECAPAGIRVNVLVPGGVETPMGAPFVGTPEARAAIERLHGLGRIAQPEEVAAAALFLLSGDASFVTGATLFADGGASVHRSMGA
ncbi:MAG: SDR family oxidoreductase [Myxococcota bacterium]